MNNLKQMIMKTPKFNLDSFKSGKLATTQTGKTVKFVTMLRNKPGYMLVAIKKIAGEWDSEKYAIDGNRYQGVVMFDSLECA